VQRARRPMTRHCQRSYPNQLKPARST
jgi:hypothetical protein